MKNKTILLLDSNYLCHRAKHSMGELSYKGAVTGVVYGFLKEVEALQQSFQSDIICFCWDVGDKIRKTIYPQYQSNRKKELNEDEQQFEWAFRKQMKYLRIRYLPTIGYKNIFWQKGYESDDIIASLCQTIDPSNKIIIISADHDMYQLLDGHISMFSPATNKTTTLQSFKKDYRILPSQWATIKALAGCSSDGVIGIERVGEKTAIKFLCGELKETTKVYKTIIQMHDTILEKNLSIVQLPYENTDVFELQEDVFCVEGYNKVCKHLGFKSLKKKKNGKTRKRLKL